jgi:hypothetical protein
MIASGWLLGLVGGVGVYLAGNGRATGWALLAAAQLLAVPDALAGRPGVLVLLVVAGGLVSLRNWHRWRRPLIPRPRIHRSQRRGVVRGRW